MGSLTIFIIDKRSSLLFVGKIAVLSNILKLPATRHQDSLEIEAFIVPNVSAEQVLQITIHGGFIEGINRLWLINWPNI